MEGRKMSTTTRTPVLLHIERLRREIQYAEAEFEKKSNGVTARQASVLSVLLEKEGVSQTHIVEMTSIDRSTLADVVRRLVLKGLVTRRRTKEDRRAYAVRLTANGRRVATDLRTIT